MMSVYESSPWMFPGNPHNSHPPFVPSFPMNAPFAAAPAPASSFPPSFSTFTPSPSSSSSAPFTLPSFNLFQQQQQPQQPSPSPSFNAFGAPSSSLSAPVFDPFSRSSGVSSGSVSGSMSMSGSSLRKTKRTMTQLDEDTDPLFRESRDFCSDDSEDSDSSVHTRGSHDSFRHLSEFPRKRSFDAYADRSITPVTSPSHTQSQSHPLSPSHSHSHSHSSSPSASASASASAWSQPPQKRVKSMFDKALEQLFEFRFDSSCERSRLDSRGGKRRKQMKGSPQLDVLEESEENDSVPNSPAPAPDAMGEDSPADTAAATATSSAAKGPLIEEEEDDPVEARKKQVMLLPSALRYRLYPTVPLPEGVTFDEFFHRPSPHTAFCLLNTSGNILECDKGLPKLLKISADDLRGKSLLAFTHVDDWGMAQQVVRRLLHGDSSSELFHQRMIDANGNTIFVRGNLFRMERNDKVYIVSKITPYDGPASASPSTIDPSNSQLRRVTRNPRTAASFSFESPSVFSSRPSAPSTGMSGSSLSIEELPDLPSDNAMSCD